MKVKKFNDKKKEEEKDILADLKNLKRPFSKFLTMIPSTSSLLLTNLVLF